MTGVQTCALPIFITSYRETAPRFATWAEENIPQGLSIFSLPPEYRRRLRTTNGLERVNREIKRRTRVAAIFPNEASLLRLVSALLAETSDDWESSKIYLNMTPSFPPSA